jgi:hypothetical protein
MASVVETFNLVCSLIQQVGYSVRLAFLNTFSRLDLASYLGALSQPED